MARRSSILVVSALWLVTAWLLLAAAPVLCASGHGSLDAAVENGRLSRDDARAIAALIEQARAQGLPEGPLAAKVEEGLAKRVPGQAIVRAVDAMRDDYAFARDALARGGAFAPTPDDVVLAGDSLRLGLSREELAELAQQAFGASPTMLATAARARAFLNGIGFPSDLSTHILSQGLESGTLTPAWIHLFKAVQRARDTGASDAAVAKAAVRTLAEGGGPGEMLHDLGLTSRDMRQLPGRPEN